MNIIVFGHSVDPLDKEIFINCFDLAKKEAESISLYLTIMMKKLKERLLRI